MYQQAYSRLRPTPTSARITRFRGLKPLTPPPHHTATDEIMYQDYAIVVTGDVFRWMLMHAPLETVQRV